jgi:hypothetical protein
MDMLEEKQILENQNRIISILQKTNREGMPALIDYLVSTDFFKAPASTKYHNAFPGGLAQHSLFVYDNLWKMNEQYKIGLSLDTIAVCALLHDVCKADVYEFALFKTKSGGRYSFSDSFPCGHGEKSMFVLMRFLKLTEQEILLIRWHMAESDMGGYYQRLSFDAARDKEPGLTALICADQLASFVMEERMARD